LVSSRAFLEERGYYRIHLLQTTALLTGCSEGQKALNATTSDTKQGHPTADVGYLLINLGTPESPEVADVRQYLNEFLMDPYVLDAPWPIRRLIVSGFILPFRPRNSAEAYAKIWTSSGSPLLQESLALGRALAVEMNAPVELGMRYGKPSVASAIEKLEDAGVRELVVVPLYPHHADSTVTTSIEHVKQSGVRLPWRINPPFYADPRYIAAQAQVIEDALPDRWDHLLLSYHGLPERHITRADPTGKHCLASPDCCDQPSPAHATCYRHQCFATSRLLARRLNLGSDAFTVSFQSRLGRLPWLRPYTDQILAELPAKGVAHLVIACPAFVADNLETLEEIGMQGRETFMQAGGKSFHLVPCLNDRSDWIAALAAMLQDQTASASAKTSL
jgi:ferrochelatase